MTYPSRTSVVMRPPTRSLASNTVTRRPARCRRNAALRPAMPAPTTTTSLSISPRVVIARLSLSLPGGGSRRWRGAKNAVGEQRRGRGAPALEARVGQQRRVQLAIDGGLQHQGTGVEQDDVQRGPLQVEAGAQGAVGVELL